MSKHQRRSARDRLLDTAGELFQRHGFRAVGIDWVLEDAAVAKATLYRLFSSKDELIAAYLERADAQFWSWADSAMRGETTPEGRLRALFQEAGRLAGSPECFGCMFQAAALAFPEHEHLVHQVAIRHKLEVIRRIAELAREANLRDPDGLANQLALLLDGAWIATRMFGGTDHQAASVEPAARALIEAHRQA
jgi:AcrR family transcriptional regulator